MYFITCLENLEIDALGLLGDSRCFGYFFTYQRAKEALEINECDMWEAGICSDGEGGAYEDSINHYLYAELVNPGDVLIKDWILLEKAEEVKNGN